MLKIGCTGGIAAGKSLFCSYMEKNGAVIIDADAVTHELLNYDKNLQLQLVGAFGEQILITDSTINRRELAAAAFSSLDNKRLLEKIVHPHLRNRILKIIERLLTQNVSLLIIEGALLVETRAVDFYKLQALVVVETPLSTAANRLRQIRKMSDEDIQKRFSIQSSPLERIRFGDFVIINSGDKGLLEKMAQNVFTAVTKDLD